MSLMLSKENFLRIALDSDDPPGPFHSMDLTLSQENFLRISLDSDDPSGPFQSMDLMPSQENFLGRAKRILTIPLACFARTHVLLQYNNKQIGFANTRLDWLFPRILRGFCVQARSSHTITIYPHANRFAST